MHEYDTWNKLLQGNSKNRMDYSKHMNYTLQMHEFCTVHAGHMHQSVPQNILIHLGKLIVQAGRVSWVQRIISDQAGTEYILTFEQAGLI